MRQFWTTLLPNLPRAHDRWDTVPFPPFLGSRRHEDHDCSYRSQSLVIRFPLSIFGIKQFLDSWIVAECCWLLPGTPHCGTSQMPRVREKVPRCGIQGRCHSISPSSNHKHPGADAIILSYSFLYFKMLSFEFILIVAARNSKKTPADHRWRCKNDTPRHTAETQHEDFQRACQGVGKCIQFR